MRRPVLKKEEVFEAADTLADDGKKVTALSILHHIGGGSLTTIYKHLDQWKQSRPQLVEDDPFVPVSVEKAFQLLWSTARQEAAKEVEAVKNNANAQINEAKQEFQEALQAIEKLESDQENNEKEIDDLKSVVSELESEKNKLEASTAAEKAKVSELRQQLKKLQSEHEKLSKEHEKIKADSKKAAELKGIVETLKAQNKDLIKAIGKPGK